MSEVKGYYKTDCEHNALNKHPKTFWQIYCSLNTIDICEFVEEVDPDIEAFDYDKTIPEGMQELSRDHLLLWKDQWPINKSAGLAPEGVKVFSQPELRQWTESVCSNRAIPVAAEYGFPIDNEGKLGQPELTALRYRLRNTSWGCMGSSRQHDLEKNKEVNQKKLEFIQKNIDRVNGCLQPIDTLSVTFDCELKRWTWTSKDGRKWQLKKDAFGVEYEKCLCPTCKR